MLSTSKALFRKPSAGGGGTTDPSFAYVPLLLNTTSTNGQQNNTFLDSGTANGGVGFTITRNGTPTQGSITPYWPNGQWSNNFNGSSNLSVASNAALAMGSGNFTVEFWVYLRATTNNRTLSWPVVGNMAINCANSGYWNYSSYGVGDILTSSIITPLNTWTHVAVSRTGTTTRIFINGVQGAITTGDANNWGQSVLNIGSDIASNFLNGYLSNLRIVKGVGVYTGAFTPPTSPLQKTQAGNGGTIQAITGTQTSLLTCQSNRFVNNSDISLTLTVANGTPTAQAFQPFSPTASYTTALYGGSSFLPTSADYLSIAADATFTFGTQNHTIEFWAYQTAFTDYSTPWNYASGATVQGTGNYYISNGGLSSNLLLGSGGAWGVNIAFTKQTLNAWHHYAITRSGSSFALFIDGVRAGTATYAGSITSQAGAMLIGRGTGTNDTYQGYISNLRIVKGVAIYDPAQTTITVPTTPVTNVTNTSLLLNFTNAGIYDAAAQNDITTVGDAQVSTTITAKWPPTSIKFDGTGDYLSVSAGSPQSLTFGTGDFTIEFWVYFTSNTGFQTLYDGRVAAGAYPLLYLNSGVINYYVGGGVVITSVQPSTGVWTFMSLIRSSGITRFFINGAQSGGSYTDANNYLAPPTSGARVGANYTGSDFLFGYIQDFRVTKAARAATPIPTAAFPTR